MTDLNLVCEDPISIGLMGTISFISFAIGSALITR
jgi:MFS family permease